MRKCFCTTYSPNHASTANAPDTGAMTLKFWRRTELPHARAHDFRSFLHTLTNQPLHYFYDQQTLGGRKEFKDNTSKGV